MQFSSNSAIDNDVECQFPNGIKRDSFWDRSVFKWESFWDSSDSVGK
jgi:hypothetical protein